MNISPFTKFGTPLKPVGIAGIGIPILKTAFTNFAKLFESLFSSEKPPDIQVKEEVKKVESKRPSLNEDAPKKKIDNDEPETVTGGVQSNSNAGKDSEKADAKDDQSDQVTNLYGKKDNNGSVIEQVIDNAFDHVEEAEESQTGGNQAKQFAFDLGNTNLLDSADDHTDVSSKPASGNEANNAAINTPLQVKVQSTQISKDSTVVSNDKGIAQVARHSDAQSKTLIGKTQLASQLAERIKKIMQMQQMNKSNKMSLVAVDEIGDRLKINLSSIGNKVRVNFVTNDRQAFELINSNQGLLQDMLKEEGIALTNFGVSVFSDQNGHGNSGDVEQESLFGSTSFQVKSDEDSNSNYSARTSGLVDILA
ncbi:MAG: flagellar hook-length control protein FliK [Planctomycetes bacterium]|nr:flagellar hook-length control protein FliK [Planctomycetota bacterium]